MLRTALLAAAVLALAAGCDDEEATKPAKGPDRTNPAETEPASPAPPPDAGTQTGHGADQARRVKVPDSDASPPSATIVLEYPPGRARARAAEPGQEPHTTVRLDRPTLQGTTIGLDENGGVARVRVSIREEITCTAKDEPLRLRTRYYPPPQVERIRSTPGADLPTRKTRSLPIELSTARCNSGAEQVRGELWGEAINGTGLEAVTPHIRLTYEVGG
jgi:hypothetical protein